MVVFIETHLKGISFFRIVSGEFQIKKWRIKHDSSLWSELWHLIVETLKLKLNIKKF
jgi:hypothetical protein